MNNYREIFKSLAWRILLASPFFIIGLSGLLSFFSPCMIVIGAVIVAFPLARLFSEPAGDLFYPNRRSSRPAPMYSIQEAKRAQGLYEEAIAGFEKIAEEYPEEVRPYIEMIDIAIVNLKDPERANKIYQRGISLLNNIEDKEALASMYRAIRSRLNAKMSN